MIKPTADFLFELSWEVCNKVGGINTVIKTKVPQMMKYYPEGYFLIGPYFQDKAVTEFQEKIPPEFLQGIFEILKGEGIVCRYGRWLVNGEPNVILFDCNEYEYKNNEVKTKLWESFKIDSLDTEFYDFDQPILWGNAVGRFLEEISKLFPDKKIVAHFHEWLSCGALLYLKRNKIKVATVFTTHGTMLGRTLAGNNIDLYKQLNKLNPEKEAYNFKVHSKYQVEKVAAKKSDVFTTVSEILTLEARYFFGKKPELLLYNGLDFSKYPTFEEISVKHRLYREKIKEFFKYYFFPYYSFDLSNTFIYFISGRYEFHNKGIDILIKALAKLNEKLRKEKSERTIAVFFWVPKPVIRIKPDLSQAKAYYEDVKESIDMNLEEIKGRIITNLISRRTISEKTLFSEDFIFETKKKVFRFLKKGSPPLCTHDLVDEENDMIIRELKRNGLLNREGDRVKVIFYPTYLSGADSLLDLSYSEAILGSHLGIFPSYYEPWGYTPLETAALGVASITTDFSGYGRYLLKLKKSKRGIFVIRMFNKSHEEKIENLFKAIYKFSKLTKEERIKNKVEAQKLAYLVDWNKLVERYIKAHNLAIERVYKIKEKKQEKS
jgi:glycogen(starch) synthase